MIQGELLVGSRLRLGPVTFGADVGIGFRDVTFATPAVAVSAMAPDQGMFVLAAHPNLDYWVSPHFSLGLLADIDVIRAGDYGGGIVLGFHLLPYGGAVSL